ncbi:urate hydroxylase PuuD [Roseitalea porphyridii]|uniref:Cysteine desulfurase n=1 Tax=Roseitalea porphyridii TaxID=1852022 RepID=A0A4P6V3I6_9HYPH|nr:urate hydroxylase PuuD [Roseitalea porphyridii]QBK31206.1 cysteine desulfurase [Roseitalea porphyridii]
MYDLAIFTEWAEFAVRWLHVITAIAWIGSSFYFIALDLGLNRDIPGPADGEEWQVHGGGFYHIQKYLVAPDALPEHLTWFKWEAYWTWISGFALLCLVYYLGADLYLVDPNVADISIPAAIAISLASLGFGWIVYDRLCKSPLGETPTALMVLLFVLLVAMAWGYTQVFSGRAALLHLGAFTATIMTANVFLIIIPNQKIVVADLKAGRTPDAKYGKIAKLRSTHNNYLTLPVIFFMLSIHYPLAFASEYNWLIAALVFLMGVTIRHYFNTRHARAGNPTWTWLATAVLFVLIMALSTWPLFSDEPANPEEARATPHQERIMASEGFEQVATIVQGRCAMCHATEPFWDGILFPPNGVRLETHAQIAAHARDIYVQSGVTHAMPPANVSFMEEAERRAIVDWYRSVQ